MEWINAVLCVLKIGKFCDTKDIEMTDRQRMKQIEESRYKCLDIIQDSEIKTQIMKDKIRTEYLRTVRKLRKSEMYARILFIRINEWALDVVRHNAGIVDWIGGDLELWDRRTRKILACNGLLHPRADVATIMFIIFLRHFDG